jgi:protein NirF
MMKNGLKSLILISLLTSSIHAKEKIFVVERESEALAVIDEKGVDEIKNMRDFNHAVVKFRGNDGYAITRDGYIIKFDPINNRKLKEYRTSKSAIGFIIGKNYVAVANYDNRTVEILDRELNPIQSIKTDSKNVGIKEYKNYLIFSCMDSDEIWVMENRNPDSKKVEFKLKKRFKNIGQVPFDAMIDKNLYVVGLFNSPEIGVVNLDTLSYKKVPLELGKKERILKVPHFGFWSISGDYFFIPAVGNRKVFVFDHNFKPVKAIDVEGNPVFTSLSPDKRFLAVTFSGKKFPVVQIIDAKKLKVVHRFQFDGWILHLRWSTKKPHLYFSVNTKDRVDRYLVESADPKNWQKIESWSLSKPSGIFLFDTENGGK